ncbi:hypothetical protein [Oxynema aestuarii]|uniref:Uncharacterized protein n=1 Tax=Oxynema aestuarii AP17 TaxID=2064643 RepID=A0A6H1TYP4_9CYAN|nr:hypothetical protein [Oxynema aestuarii]QIZ71267.1 hypothetical protein HCG48_12295 [Oxynema aestuarii AP17]
MTVPELKGRGFSRDRECNDFPLGELRHYPTRGSGLGGFDVDLCKEAIAFSGVGSRPRAIFGRGDRSKITSIWAS